MEARMLRKGLAVAVILLFIGVAFTSSINANVSKSSVEPIVDVDVKEENATPIVLVFQLISKLRNHKDIESVETEDDVLRIIEGDEELNSIFEQLSVEDCDCEDETTEWPFLVICGLLYPAAVLSWVMFYLPMLIFGPNWPGFIGGFFYMIMKNIGTTLNCSWADL